MVKKTIEQNMAKQFSNQSVRAGRYITQPSGYRAFFPASLPPTPSVDLSGELQSLLSKADRALGRLDGSILTLPSTELFVAMYVRKEAVLSSQIEGTESSLQDLLSAEAKIRNRNRPDDVAEIVNYVAAMNHGLRRLPSIPVSVRLLRELHERLLRGTRGSLLTPGDFRTTQNWIGPAKCTFQEARFVPPPPYQVGSEMSELEKFIHAESDLPLLIKIALAHCQFETIHPFLDGNGRLGRLLITFLLCERNVLHKPVLYLSLFFKKHRQQYYDELQSVRDNGTWERWIRFFLMGVLEVSEQASVTARAILDLREKHQDIINRSFGHATANAHRILQSLYSFPITSVAQVQSIIQTTYAPANSLIARMEDTGIVREITGHKRNRRFEYHDYVSLFAQD
ncbi:MAG: Fic family protein [Gammaproteobacteria bacterium]|nr:Fic family protein [Gammaproteobacteria bacterium]